MNNPLLQGQLREVAGGHRRLRAIAADELDRLSYALDVEIASRQGFVEQVVSLAARVADLTDALNRHGRHDRQCEYTQGLDKCDCGLDAALNRTEGET